MGVYIKDTISQKTYWSSGSYNLSGPSFEMLPGLLRGCVVDVLTKNEQLAAVYILTCCGFP